MRAPNLKMVPWPLSDSTFVLFIPTQLLVTPYISTQMKILISVQCSRRGCGTIFEFGSSVCRQLGMHAIF